MSKKESWRLVLGGLLAMAAALGIGRFVYTPILPVMLDALGWTKVDAGLIASANFLGYLIGALLAAGKIFSANPRRWLLAALLVSAVTTAAMAAPSQMHAFIALRLLGGMASAFVIVSASTLVLERLAAAGHGDLAAVHFAGVGVGVMVSAAAVATLIALGGGWRSLWAVTGLLALVAAPLVAAVIPAAMKSQPVERPAQRTGAKPRLAGIIVAYGLFGFGYVITATFLVAIVRETAEIRPLEPWIWMLFGFAAVPSVPIWHGLGRRIGLARAYALACLVEAIGVAASVEWATIAGACLSAVLLGGTFMGLTALGLMRARAASGDRPHRAIALATASFGAGQMVGPTLAGVLSEYSGSLRGASLAAAAALVLAAAIACFRPPAGG
jgi:predicted MFS family arabinose efflux permease